MPAIQISAGLWTRLNRAASAFWYTAETRSYHGPTFSDKSVTMLATLGHLRYTAKPMVNPEKPR